MARIIDRRRQIAGTTDAPDSATIVGMAVVVVVVVTVVVVGSGASVVVVSSGFQSSGFASPPLGHV